MPKSDISIFAVSATKQNHRFKMYLSHLTTKTRKYDVNVAIINFTRLILKEHYKSNDCNVYGFLEDK